MYQKNSRNYSPEVICKLSFDNILVLLYQFSCWHRYITHNCICLLRMKTNLVLHDICVSVRLSDRSLHREEQKKFVKNCPQLGLNPWPLDHHANALPTELSQHSVASLKLHGLHKVMLYEQSLTCEVAHETNKTHFRNLLPNRFLPSSVSRALKWWSRGHGFNPDWGQFLTNFILLFPV